MFERYTEQARRTIFFALKEASNFGSPYIETEHLLLGLLHDGFLTSFALQGISVQRIRDDIMATLPRRKEIPTSVDLPLSKNAKQALSYGAEEAERLADRQIRNQHLLLGLMRVEASYGAQMLRQKGLDPANLRLRIAELQPEEEATIHGAGGGGWDTMGPKITGYSCGLR
jgi:ATP-dependent Clp protease ATP-binding subunit ClpC